MINHARTLLINPTSEQIRDMPSRPYNRFVPKEYVRVLDSIPGASLQRILFGQDPDPWTLNFLSHQYMQVLESPAYQNELKRYDSRITHLGIPNKLEKPSSGEIEILSGTIKPTFINIHEGNEGLGKNELWLEVAYGDNAGNIDISYEVKRPTPTQTGNTTVAVGTPVKLGNTGLSVRIDALGTGSTKLVSYARPAKTLEKVVKEIDDREQLIDNLDANKDTHTYADWYKNGDLDLDRLAGTLLTLISQREAQRG